MYLDVILLDIYISLSPQSSYYTKPKELPFRRLRDTYAGLDLGGSRSLEIRAESDMRFRAAVFSNSHALDISVGVYACVHYTLRHRGTRVRARTADLCRVLDGVARSLARSLCCDNNYRTGSVALRRAWFMLELYAACIEKEDEMNGAFREREKEER